MDALGAMSAMDATRRHVTSAQPGAPVREPRAPRRNAGPGRVRAGTAGMLRRLADRLERRPVPAGEVPCG